MPAPILPEPVDEGIIVEENHETTPGAGLVVPRVVNRTHGRGKGVDRRIYVAGEGPRDGSCQIMFISTTVLEEEAAETQATSYGGKPIRLRPRYLKGAPGAIFKDACDAVGIDMRQCYYTALMKWLHPNKAQRLKPKREDLEAMVPALYAEIEAVKPEIIVCLGKVVFDLLKEIPLKIPIADIKCAWFRSERFKCRIFPMDEISKPVYRPEYLHHFKTDLTEVKKMLDTINGVGIISVEKHYRTIDNLGQTAELVGMWHQRERTVQSVDCEWWGNNHVDGKLRSIQFCWDDGYAAYFKFLDETGKYVFDAPYKQVGQMLGCWLDQPKVKYIGHHIAADFPWMDYILGLKWYNKCAFDTEFGQQCIDEHEDLGLERQAIKYTDLGRYDLDVYLWVKANKHDPTDGYGKVPDNIIIPYGCSDVDTVYRSVPKQIAELYRQKLDGYYFGIFLPFVSNVFTQFALAGLPMSEPMMDELRALYHFSREHMETDLKKVITLEAKQLLLRQLMENAKNGPAGAIVTHCEIENLLCSGEHDKALQSLKQEVGVANLLAVRPFLDHRIKAPNFNIRSVDDMRRWLFQVKGFTPVKTTSQKEKGRPSMPWEKVMNLRPEMQKEYLPSVDKQTLQILGEGDNTVGQLLELNAVGNICKAFMREADKDEDGNVTKENGLHFWLASDKHIHGQTSTTETGRPRSWRPNALNFPKFTNKKICKGIGKLLRRLQTEEKLPEEFEKYLIKETNEKTGEVNYTSKVPSIRSCVSAEFLEPVPGSKGWCLVESDYQTAEVRALAFISGDEALIKLICEPDTNFALLKDDPKADPIRIGFHDTGCDPEIYKGLLYAVTKKGEFVRKVYDYELLKDERGRLVHPKADLHWALSEAYRKTPRELLDKEAERDPAKIVRFSGTYGATGNTLDRKIEQDTGKKPPEGTGEALLGALQAKQPDATKFQKNLESVPKDPGWWRSESGRVRHFYTHPDYTYEISARQQRNMLSSLSREMLNFPYQEIVAATSAKAAQRLLDDYQKRSMYARPLIVLYDAVVTLCPIEERFLVEEMHQKYMSEENEWHNHGRTWNFPIDTAYSYRWSWKPEKADLKNLEDPTWYSDPAWISDEHKKVA